MNIKSKIRQENQRSPAQDPQLLSLERVKRKNKINEGRATSNQHTVNRLFHMRICAGGQLTQINGPRINEF